MKFIIKDHKCYMIDMKREAWSKILMELSLDLGSWVECDDGD